MAEYDISMHGIRVVLDPAYYEQADYKAPLDIEGTVLSIIDGSRLGFNLMKEGRFIELVCDPTYNSCTDIYIRWDSDEKEWFTGGTMLLRCTKMSFCSSIWSGDGGVKLDTRPFQELRPSTYECAKNSFTTNFFAKYTAAPEIHIPIPKITAPMPKRLNLRKKKMEGNLETIAVEAMPTLKITTSAWDINDEVDDDF